MAAFPEQKANNITSSLVQLKRGAKDGPLFLFSGGAGNPQDLIELATRLRNHRTVIGVDFCRPDNHGQVPSKLELLADRSHSEIRAFQPRGPYHIVGYSFGGLVAIEIARLLQKSGERIALLGLIDTFFDHRFWPMRPFLRSQTRLLRRHFRALSTLPISQMLPTMHNRSRRLFFRLLRRQMPLALTIKRSNAENATATEQHCITMMSNYRPKYYPGKVILFNAENHEDYGCDPGELWRGMVENVECRTIRGTHVEMLTNNASLTDLAAALDSNLVDPKIYSQ
jgi:acetoacetyl-CoA synthetase